MQRKLIKDHNVRYKHYTDSEIRKYVESELDNPSFKNHCAETARNLGGISAKIVEDVLKDKAFQTHKLLQKSVLQQVKIKINIFGYLFFRTHILLRKINFIKS